jgi:glycine/D-amino acid oxidase-like deaminating enzyme
MAQLPDKRQSYWAASTAMPTYEPLYENLSVDTVIVGGGITGLTVAYLLKQSKQTVAVLEQHTLGYGTTGGTTGKVTSQHGLMYDDLKQRLGEKTARIYAEANQTALEQINRIIDKEKIACDWRREDNYVYTTNPEKVEQFKSEAKVAASLGLPATFETKLPLPFEVNGAVKFANQATFHSMKYIAGLAAAVHGGGSYVFENSKAEWINDGSLPNVKTENATVKARNIIVATKIPSSPLLARLGYALLEHPQTSYIVAGKFKDKLPGMYISPDEGQYSILPVGSGKDQLLLIGGENHLPGLGRSINRHQKLTDYAEKHFGIKQIDYRWKAMDYIAYDEVPLIGKVYPWSDYMYTATGFKKWGLSTSMVAGMILHDLIMGQENPWATTFNAMRSKPILSIPRAIANTFK